MPICVVCGMFEEILKPRELCTMCFIRWNNDPQLLDKTKIINRKVQYNINYPTLTYLSDLYPNQRFNNLNSQGIFSIMENMARMVQRENQERPLNDTYIAERYTQSTQANNLGQQENNNNHTYRPEYENQNLERGSISNTNLGGNYNRNNINLRVQNPNMQIGRPPGFQVNHQQRPVGFQHYLKSNIALILLVIAFFFMGYYISIPLLIIAIVLAILAKRDEYRSWRIPVVIFGAIILLFFEILLIIFEDSILEMIEMYENMDPNDFNQ